MQPSRFGEKQPTKNKDGQFTYTGAMLTSQQHRNYYSSLYKFKAEVQLSEYALPFLSGQPQASQGQESSMQEGESISQQGSKRLPPIVKRSYGNIDEAYDSMEGSMDMEREYGGEEYKQEREEERSLDVDGLIHMMTADQQGKGAAANARANLFVEKGSYIHQQLMKIKSGEQAISFFAKHGSITPVKFLLCNRAATPPEIFRPYDLLVVGEKELASQHFTISAQGVVHVLPDKTKPQPHKGKPEIVPTEFFTLSDWMHQSTMFNVISSINFFKHYRIGKVFGIWKGNVRYRLFSKTRQRLANNLIYSKPAFTRAFIDINRTLFDTQKTKVFNAAKTAKPSELDNFVSDQSSEREAAKQHYEKKVIEIVARLKETVKDVTDSLNLKEEEDLEKLKLGQKVKQKSMVIQKEEDRLKRRVLRIANSNFQMLGTFIRLVDYLEIEVLIRINQDSLDSILEEMVEKNRKTCILTQAIFQQGMIFQPAESEVVTAFDSLIIEMLKACDSISRVLHTQDFKVHLQNLLTHGGPSIQKIVERSYSHKLSCKNIESNILQNFRELQKIVDVKYEKCRDIEMFANTWKFEEYKEQEHTVQEIKAKLQQLQIWFHNINTSISSQVKEGIIQLLGRRKKEQLTTVVSTAYTEIMKYLNALALEKAEHIIKSYGSIKTKLDRKYSELRQFVDYVSSFKQAELEVKNLTIEKTTLDQMVQTLKQRNSSNSFMPNVISLMGLSAKMNYVQQAILDNDSVLKNAESNIVENQSANSNDLGNKIENVKNELKELITKIDSESLTNPNTEPEAALKELNKLRKEFESKQKESNTFNNYQEVLGIQPKEVKEVKDFQKKFETRHLLWDSLFNWNKQHNSWFNDNFFDIDVGQLEKDVKEYERKAMTLRSSLRDRKDLVVELLLNNVKNVTQYLSLIIDLGNSALEARHWNKIFKLLESQRSYSENMQLTLSDLFKEGVTQFRDKVEEISAFASGERNIRITIEEIQKAWEETEFFVMNYRDMKDRYIIAQIDDTITQLEDHQVSVGTMLGSKFVQEIRPQVDSWEKKLSYISDVIDEWLTCQRQWMYLENIFSAEDIQKQLPQEAQKFQQVDKFWRENMNRTNKNRKVLAVTESEGLLGRFQNANNTLDEIQKSLEDYLETKRSAFPRFYFLSNDELIEILSQTRNPQAVQPHLRKCFDSIAKIKFTEEKNSKSIISMISAEKEEVPFFETVVAQGKVEHWLLMIEGMMKKTLYQTTKKAFLEYPGEGLDRAQWLFRYPAQCVLTVDQIKWTWLCMMAILQVSEGKDQDGIKKFLEFSKKQISKMVDLIRGELTGLQRTLMGALIVLDVHARDVVANMIRVDVNSLNDFEWTRQLRYYWEHLDPEVEQDRDDCVMRQTNTRFIYGYEYLGNGPRLVITPLTDKCYMTLTGAIHLNYGGNPQGPAGTGKTETTKDLAKAMAIQCVVFNCSDGLDYRMMGRFFSGLAQSGAWSCFDEFNRIEIEVLSVIAQQILTIQSAIRSKVSEFQFGEHIIPLNPKFGVFITMNPGYAGRTELPDNMKALFRPISMMVPDYGLIAEIILFSEGFETAHDLARKMVQLYKLSSEQLSKQDHYDFGMRAVKSVLVMAGALRRKNPDLSEDVVLIRAMRDSNVPKFLEQDLPLFRGIVNDLFPGVTVPNVDYGDLKKAVLNQLDLNNYMKPEDYVIKIIQLLETMIVRHGIMLVGLTGTGKTVCSEILKKSLTQLKKDGSTDPMHEVVHVHTLNPKAITMGELYGMTNSLTGEWTNGLVAKLVRDTVEIETLDKTWIIFDGPVDALWIENMNTVLDDNKMLCLANGERIKLNQQMTMMFEVQDLRVASPATVSRCGMVYLEPVHLGWEPIVESWAIKATEWLPPNCVSIIVSNLKQLGGQALSYIREECKECIPSVDMNLVQSCLNLINCLLDPEKVDLKKAAAPEKIVIVYFIFSFIWSFGANLQDQYRPKFNRFLRLKIASLYTDFPDSGQIYDYCVDPNYHRFGAWQDRIPQFSYNKDLQYFAILVPTPDTVKYKFILDTLVTKGYHTLMTGETGVGKSVIVQDFLNNAGESMVSAFVNFSGKTQSKNLQDVFESKLEKKRKTLLGPPGGKKMILFLDDVNMPQLDRYGSQPPIELLRQTIDNGGIYDTKKLHFKHIADTYFACACAPPSGGRNEVTPRLFRHFNMIWFPDLSIKSMELIFSSILKGFLELNTQSSLQIFAESIVRASVEIYQKIRTELLPTPTKSHYTFNLRDLSKVVQGILQIKVEHLQEKQHLVNLWLHEEFRVFRDRLINEKDRDWFNTNIEALLKRHLDIQQDKSEFAGILFGHAESEDNDYAQMMKLEAVVPILMDKLAVYSSTYKPMDLVFFQDAISHLFRASRVLHQNRGNVLLVGVGGSGRSSLARLASFMSNCQIYSIEIAKNYREKEWHEDIKNMLRTSGVDGQDVSFVFSDTQIIMESFLEDINNILNTGEVPNLFENDEMEAIVGDLRPKLKQQKIQTRDQIIQYFVQKCRDKLHIVLTFSPVGEQFRDRCRQFPSIINCCTIDWYNQWPADALFSVAQKFYSENETLGKRVKDVCKMCVQIHQSVSDKSEEFFQELRRKNYTTPTSYLELIKLYLKLLKEQSAIVPGKINRYKMGLKRLQETNQIVNELSATLVKLEPQIEQQEKETQQLVIVLEKRQKEANEKEKVVSKDAAVAQKIFTEVQELRNDCQSKLDQAMPIYHKALAALNTLNKTDINEMKAYTTPPGPLKLVVEAVCLLLGKNESWEEGRKQMNDPQKFINQLKAYDKDKIPQKILSKLKKYIKDPDFKQEKIQSVSKAAVSLYMWVIALDRYSAVMKIIQPKQKDLAIAEKKLKVADDDYNAKKATLQAARDLVAELQADYSAKQKKLEELTQQRELIKVQQGRAEKLVTGLATESKRWEENTKILEEDLKNIIGNIILVAGSISYLGPFNAKYRQSLLDSWIQKCKDFNLQVSGNFSLEHIIADPVQVREWNQSGLPGDKLSIENAILMANSARWCLIIDPQSQANRFIKNFERENKLHVIKLSDAKFLQILEGGIRTGQPVLLENIDDHLDPALDPILLKHISKGMLRLGDKDIPWSNEFRFYITTKLANPHYLPEVCIKVTILNFTVTPLGLEDQLLVDVIGFEMPELEEQRDKLITQLSDFKRDLKDIEDRILKLVSEAGEDILDDEELIITLDQSKQMSTAIQQRMKEAQETAQKIDSTRQEYRPVAKRGSVLYFVIADLALVDPMYQYSLEFFVKLFKRRLEKSAKSEDRQTRLNIIINDITNAFYENICRGLFEKDKLLYSFLNTSNILRRDSKISMEEWNFFLRGTRTDYSDQNSGVNFMDDLTWQRALGLEEAHYNFRDLAESIKDAADGVFWREIMSSQDPHRLPLPTRFEDRLTPFQRLMTIKTLREEKTVFAVKQFVKTELGLKFIQTPSFDLNAAYQDSTSTSPIIFVLSPGADPLIYLQALAKEKEMDGGRMKLLALGQGQGGIAKRYIEQGQRNGDWVVLQNCHLAITWMPTLERIQEHQVEADTHEEYRLWLTSMPSPNFPVPVLQNGIKLTNEPPRGLQANMVRTFNEISGKYYESSSKPRPFKKLLFALAFFHAVILERRKFGAIGWNIPYEWMTSDFITSDKQLFMYLEEQEDIPYIALNYLIADINYGGRVTDDKDNRLIRAILKSYFVDNILSDSYRLSQLDTYYAPPEGSYEELRKYIDTLPLDDDPEVFGLHPNANITFQQKMTKELMDTVIIIQPRATGGKQAKTPEEIVSEMARDFEMQMPDYLEKKRAHPDTFAKTDSGAMISLGVFIGQEIDRFNKMLKVIKKSLNELQKAIKGTVVMSLELEHMFDGFLIQKVPKLWEKVAYLSLKPLGSWVIDMIARFEFIRDWLERGPPISYWVPAFFFPQGFMTATLQTHARKTMIPIDTLKFRTEIQKNYKDEYKTVHKDGVNIYGLFLQGASWSIEKHQVIESEQGQLFQEMPVIWLEPVKIEIQVDPLWYQCPTYKTTTRAGELSTTGHSTNFILYLDLPSKVIPDHWIRRGVALLCLLDD